MEKLKDLASAPRLFSLKQVLAIILIAMAGGTSLGYAVVTLTGRVPVTVTGPLGPLLFTSAVVVVNDPASFTPCSISGDGLTATCPSIAITTTSINVFSLTVKNTGSNDLPLTVTTSSDNPSVAVLTSNPLNPSSIRATSQAIFVFTIEGLAPGTANLLASLTG